MLITVVEMPEFIKKSGKLFSADELLEIVFTLSTSPHAGAIMRGTGGVRKLRWSAKGKGKSGGARLIYYFHDDTIPLIVLTAFGKNQKMNLSQSERNELKLMVKQLVKSYKRKE